jgi:hypothetical protein
MATRILSSGAEPNYAAEKLWRTFRASARTLIRDLDYDPQALIQAIERATATRGALSTA